MKLHSRWMPSATSVGRRLMLGFGCLLGLLLLVTAVALYEFRQMEGGLNQIVQVNDRKSDLAHSLLDKINRLAIEVRTISMLTDVKDTEREFEALKTSEKAYWAAERELSTLIASSGMAEESKLVSQINESAKATMPSVMTAALQGRSGANADAVTTLLEEVRPKEVVWRTKVVELVDLQGRSNSDAYASAQADQRRGTSLALVIALVSILFGAFIGWRITSSVKRPIDEAIEVAERVAHGDLTAVVDVARNDEFGRLLQAVATMQERLKEVVWSIRQIGESIEVASAEVAAGNQDLSARTEVTSANLQATAGSMEQLARTIRHSSSAAEQASQLALSASDVAKRGGTVVSKVVATMNEINASSSEIADIVGVIDGIAFQTNILALNAAVEAARAGEQGRGFAVVAGEVRALAQRSAEAAKEIKSLIGTNVGRVEGGTALVQEAGVTMNDIVTSVQRVADIILEISSATGEQSTGISNMSSAIGELDHMTQQNAALVEQSAAASESLKEQAKKMMLVVEIFKLQAT